MLEFAKLDAKRFSLHSPLIGGATDAFNNNVPHYVIDQAREMESSDTKYLTYKLFIDLFRYNKMIFFVTISDLFRYNIFISAPKRI